MQPVMQLWVAHCHDGSCQHPHRRPPSILLAPRAVPSAPLNVQLPAGAAVALTPAVLMWQLLRHSWLQPLPTRPSEYHTPSNSVMLKQNAPRLVRQHSIISKTRGVAGLDRPLQNSRLTCSSWSFDCSSCCVSASMHVWAAAFRSAAEPVPACC